MKGEIKMTNRVKRGDIFYVQSLFTNDRGMHTGSPAVCVSNDTNNKFNDSIQVVYLSKKQQRELPCHVPVEGNVVFDDDNSINQDMLNSTILVERLATISLERIKSKVGRLSTDKMKEVDKAIKAQLGLDTEEKTHGKKKRSFFNLGR